MFQSAAAAPSPVMGNMPPNDAMPGGPMPPGFFQVRPSAPPHLSAALLFSPPYIYFLRTPSHLTPSSSISDSKTSHSDSWQNLHILNSICSTQGRLLYLTMQFQVHRSSFRGGDTFSWLNKTQSTLQTTKIGKN